MLLRWMTALALAASLALVVVLGYQNRTLRSKYAALASRNAELRPGQFVPAFRSSTPTGEPMHIAAEGDGTVEVLYLFTWTCPYCRESLPAINAIAQRMSNSHIARSRLVGVSLDSLTRPDDPRLDLYKFPLIRFPERRYQRLYRASRVPALLVIADDGRVLFSRYGVIRQDVVDSVAAVITQNDAAARSPGS